MKKTTMFFICLVEGAPMQCICSNPRDYGCEQCQASLTLIDGMFKSILSLDEFSDITEEDLFFDLKRESVSGRQSRGKLIMPCGTGKSLTAFWIAEALKAKTIIVAVPSLALVRQSLSDWT